MRLVQLRDFGTPRADWFVHRKEIIPVPPRRVWKALTEPDELVQWWCDDAEVELQQGGSYRFSGNSVFGQTDEPPKLATSVEDAVITEFRPEERLQFRWTLDGTETLVTFDLENLMELTELRVLQTADKAPASWALSDDAPNWWWIALPNLRSHIENGRATLRVNYRDDAREPPFTLSADFTTFPWVIWSKLTLNEELSKWWSGDASIDLTGSREFTFGDAKVGPQNVVDADEGRLLRHDWHWGDGPPTTIEWKIEDTDDATRVTLSDLGPWDSSVRRDYRLIYWASRLLLLKQMSERGVTPSEYQDDQG